MSKTHSKENSLFNDTASTAIAGHLESRLRELEKNIAVAHEFIKLADESYNQVRHEWDLLQNDTPTSKKALEFPSFPSASKSADEDTFEDIPSFREKKTRSSHENSFKTFGPSNTHTPSLGAKPETPTKKKDNTESTETKTSEPEHKEPKQTKHKKGKRTSPKN